MAEARRFAITPQLDIEQILLDAQQRWLRPAEICEILRNYQKFRIAPEPPNKPPSGSLFLFDRKVLRYFRKDGHNWRKKKDGKTVKEAHERLKSGSVDVLHCYYAHGEENENFQRRSYWMLEEGSMHIVLVHYLEVKGTKASYRSIREMEDTAQVTHLDSPVGSNSFTHQSHGPSLTTDGETANSAQVSVYEDDESDNYQASSRYHSHLELQQYGDGPVMDAFLLNPYVPLAAFNSGCDYQRSQVTEPESGFYSVVPGEISREYGETSHGLTIGGPRKQLELTSLDEILQHSIAGFQNANFQASVASMQPAALEVNPDKQPLAIRGLYTDGYNIKQKGVAIAQGQFLSTSRDINDRTLEESLISNTEVDSFSTSNVKVKKDPFMGRINNDPSLLKQPSLDLADIVGEGFKKYDSFSRWMSKELEEVEDTDMKSSSGFYWDTADSGNVADSSVPNPELLDPYLMTPSLSQDQLFSIIDFSPSWTYTGSGAKVLVTGKFLKDKQDVHRCKWSCMFGEVEVPAEILADGILRCQAPPHKSGRFPFYVTCSNRLACSELREFEYRIDHAQNMETSDSYLSSTNELNLHIRLERLLSLGPAENCLSSVISLKSKLSSKIISLPMETDEEWHDLLNVTCDGSISPDNAKDRLLEKLLKDKLHMWLLHKVSEDGKGPNVLDREGQGVLHLAAAIGYDWAIKPTIAAGVSINFRDVHGWTALHWAAFCGRERAVGTLIALGAAPGALTDPTPEFPTGRTPADLASANKHKGIAGFLAESSLTSHLSTLKLKELEGNDTSEFSDQRNNEAVVGTRIPQLADREELATSMQESLSAIRNAAQAAARIHQVFRVQSFQRKKLIEYDDDKLGISNGSALSLLSLKASRLGHDDLAVHAAATKIQTKFRGWKGRKQFLIIRQRIVKIQAHIRGHQVRRHYKKIVWSVGIVEKAILRWRRKGLGLRGFRSEGLLVGPTVHNQSSKEDDYDFLKEGRKQAEARTEKALARVKSMAQYPEARDQYRRLLTVMMELQESKAMQEDLLDDSEATDGNLTIEAE